MAMMVGPRRTSITTTLTRERTARPWASLTHMIGVAPVMAGVRLPRTEVPLGRCAPARVNKCLFL